MICANCNTPVPDNSRYCLSCGSDPSDPGTSPRIELNAASDHLFTQLRAAVVDHYDLKELLGRGGMGAVFLATDRKLDRPVAIKVLPPELSHDANVVERFEREARTAAKLDHPSIIPIYSVESQGDFHYFVMKFVTGRSLEQILEAGPMPVDLVRRIIWEAACALGHAHQRGVVHRDIKPANIMIDEGGRTVLTDFGISKAVESATQQLTATGQVVGTPHYMSPEQSKGVDVDGRSDQYSLAVVAYLMLAGKLPFDEDTIHAVLYKKLFEDPNWIKDARDDVPDYMADALHKALMREPEQRFDHMEGFATAIWPENPVDEPSDRPSAMIRTSRSSIEGDTTELTPSAAAMKRPRKKRKAPLVLASLVVIGGGAVGGWYWLDRQAQQPTGGESANQPAVTVLDTAGSDTGQAVVNGSAAEDSTVSLAENTPTGEEERTREPPDNPVTPAVSGGRETQSNPQTQRPVPQQPVVPQVGWITIGAVPVYGTVFVDGIEIQDTPVSRHELSPGAHIIEVRREGYVTVVDTVQVTAGNSRSIRYTLVRRQ